MFKIKKLNVLTLFPPCFSLISRVPSILIGCTGVFTSAVELQRPASSSGRSSNLLSRCGGDGCSPLVGGARSADSESSSEIGGAVRESGGVTCIAAGGDSGRSGLWSSLLVEGGGDSGGEDLSAAGPGGGGSMGATSFLIRGGEAGGVVGFSGHLKVRSAEEILGFGARGGLDLGHRSSSGVSLDKEEVWGYEGGFGEEGGGDAESVDALRGELGGKSDWLVRLVQGFTVGLDLGLAGGLLVSSV